MSFNENLYLQSLRKYLDFVKSFQEQHLRLLLLLLRCCQNGEGVFLNFQAIIMKKISKQTKYWLTPLFKKKAHVVLLLLATNVGHSLGRTAGRRAMHGCRALHLLHSLGFFLFLHPFYSTSHYSCHNCFALSLILLYACNSSNRCSRPQG